MFVDPIYSSNEVEGSFWRPFDYMAKVPNAHIIGMENNAPSLYASKLAAKVDISKEGIQMVQQGNRDNVVFSSEDGIVKKFSFNVHKGELELADVAL